MAANMSLLKGCFIASFQAIFLARLIGPEVATASAHNSLKSIFGNSSSIELATRHCFLLEDPPKGNKDSVDRYVILNGAYISLSFCCSV